MLRLKRKPGFVALDGIAIALAGLLLLELHFATQPPDVRARHSAWSASQAQNLQVRDFPAPKPSVATMRNLLLSRPLFDPARRPAPTQGPMAPVEIPRLSGIMVTPTEKIAIFSPAIGAPFIVNQNSRFGPFTVLAISNDSVTIKSPSGVIVLRSNFSSGAAAEIARAKSTLLVDGVYLSLVRLALPNAINWPQPPTAH